MVAPAVAPELLEIGAAVVEEHADLAGVERRLLVHPDGLPAVKARLHTVARHTHAEVRRLRHFRADRLHLIALPVEKLARAGRDGQRVQRQAAQHGRFRRGGKALALAQERDVFQRAAAALRVQPGEQAAGVPAGERARDIVHVQHAAQRQKLLRVRERGVIFPLRHRLIRHGHTGLSQCVRQRLLAHAVRAAQGSDRFTKGFVHMQHLRYNISYRTKKRKKNIRIR